MHLNFNLKLKQQSLAPLWHVQLLSEWVYSRADLTVKYIYGIYNRTTYLSSIRTGEIGRQIISQSCKHTITYRYKYTWEGIETVRDQSHVRYHIRRDCEVVRISWIIQTVWERIEFRTQDQFQLGYNQKPGRGVADVDNKLKHLALSTLRESGIESTHSKSRDGRSVNARIEDFYN
jgi:hypothetical protein